MRRYRDFLARRDVFNGLYPARGDALSNGQGFIGSEIYVGPAASSYDRHAYDILKSALYDRANRRNSGRASAFCLTAITLPRRWGFGSSPPGDRLSITKKGLENCGERLRICEMKNGRKESSSRPRRGSLTCRRARRGPERRRILRNIPAGNLRRRWRRRAKGITDSAAGGGDDRRADHPLRYLAAAEPLPTTRHYTRFNIRGGGTQPRGKRKNGRSIPTVFRP